MNGSTRSMQVTLWA